MQQPPEKDQFIKARIGKAAKRGRDGVVAELVRFDADNLKSSVASETESMPEEKKDFGLVENQVSMETTIEAKRRVTDEEPTDCPESIHGAPGGRYNESLVLLPFFCRQQVLHTKQNLDFSVKLSRQYCILLHTVGI